MHPMAILLRNRILVICATLILFGCTRVVRNDHNQCSTYSDTSQQGTDTIYDCGFTQIGNQVWMSENLCVRTFRNGDTVEQASSYNEWCQYADKQEPAYYPINIELDYYRDLIVGDSYGIQRKLGVISQVPQYNQFFLYNQYAVSDERKLCPKGWRLPTKDDWSTLFKNVKDDKCLLDTVGVVMSFGNKYGFSLRPTPYGFAGGKYDFNMYFAIYWVDGIEKIRLNTIVAFPPLDFEANASNENEMRKIILNEYCLIPVLDSPFEQPSNQYNGCCVRCIKE